MNRSRVPGSTRWQFLVAVACIACLLPTPAQAQGDYVQEVRIDDSQFALVYGTITWTSVSTAVVDLTVIDAAYDGWCAQSFPIADVVDSRKTAYACGVGTDGSHTWVVRSSDEWLEWVTIAACGFYQPTGKSNCDGGQAYENPLLRV